MTEPKDSSQGTPPVGPARQPADSPGAPNAGDAAGSGDRRPVFGVDESAAPGQVPWGLRQVIYAVLIASAPVLSLYALAALLPANDSATATTGPGFAALTVVLTAIIDGWYLLWAWVFSLRRWRLPLRSLGFRPVGRQVLWIVPVALVVVYTASALYLALYQHFVGPPPRQDIVTLFPHTAAGLILFAVIVEVVAPFFEETIFRGFIFQGLASTWGPVPGALVSAAFFGLIHQQFGLLFVPFFVLGLALAGVFYWTRSLWATIALHAAFNMIGVLTWWLVT